MCLLALYTKNPKSSKTKKHLEIKWNLKKQITLKLKLKLEKASTFPTLAQSKRRVIPT
jgi:hypothetical protein